MSALEMAGGQRDGLDACLFSPLVSGLGSPAGARCTVPPADRDAWPESPPAADRNTHTDNQRVL